jgi:membrane-bound ClpP family serine protease
MPNWTEILREIEQYGAQGPVDAVRRKYLKELHNYTERNIIAYYSGFLSKPNVLQTDIDDEDKNGFMMATHKVTRDKGLDLILHTPGGSIAATQSIVDYLHKMFGKNIRAIVPQIAMSAGTMIACSCKEILMGKQSNLGPIDPHLYGIPAYGVKNEFKRACRECKQDSTKIPIWQSIIGQYRPTFLSQCENAIDWSNKFVREQLTDVMFEEEANAEDKARGIVKKLTNYKKTHSWHIHADECKKIGLNVKMIESDRPLQDLILTVHHCFMHTLMNTPSYKIIENHLGAALVKKQTQVIPQHSI